MDTLSLTKESNVMSQADLDNLGTTYSFPQRVQLRIPGDGETILSARQGEVAFYEAAFLAGLRFPIHPTIWDIFDSLPDLPCAAVPQRVAIGHMFAGDLADLQTSPILWESCNKLPTLSEVDAKRMEAVFGKIEPGGYFEVSKVLNSRTFKRHFAGGCSAFSTSGGDNTTSGDEGEFGTGEDSVEYLGVKDPFANLLSGTSGSSSDSGSDSISDSELPPELRSDAMSARGKAVAEKAKKAAAAKHPTKGVVIREKRTREGDLLIEIGEEDSLKGKETVPPPPPKRFKSNRGAINARGHAAEAGTSSPAGDRESQSMSDASVTRRLLTGVIPASDRKKSTNYPRMTWSPNLSTSWVVVYASSLALRSQEHLHDIDFHMARADSAELELVKAQKRAVKAETRVAELNEEISRPGTEVDDLKTTVAELTSKLAKAKELAIEDFKASEEFEAAVTDSAATYFGDGFEFCKRQLLHQFPNLGADVANMAMDPSFARGGRGDEGRRRPPEITLATHDRRSYSVLNWRYNFFNDRRLQYWRSPIIGVM
ncbi:hypothetical protein Acr_00g0024230 [Actinidia rufa]|uniref:Uncharacterized protein n=1 Tax=Actinidia rufa TaxID=165716 RepID=A0A7J0DEV7_9ERIC|nr:hypothetical protein Acr_00g0024230 [Actinidia rufa]